MRGQPPKTIRANREKNKRGYVKRTATLENRNSRASDEEARTIATRGQQAREGAHAVLAFA